MPNRDVKNTSTVNLLTGLRHKSRTQDSIDPTSVGDASRPFELHQRR